jgi:hypothetical protein
MVNSIVNLEDPEWTPFPTAIRFAVPALPWVVWTGLSGLTGGAFERPLVTNSFGVAALILAAILTVGGWLIFPLLRRLRPAWLSYLTLAAWVFLTIVPGVLIVVMGPAIIVVVRSMSA